MGTELIFIILLVTIFAVNFACVRWIDMMDEFNERKRKMIVYGHVVDDFYGTMGTVLSVIWLLVHILALYLLTITVQESHGL